MSRCIPFRSDGLHCGVDRTATLMTEHNNQAGGQTVDSILDASQAFLAEHIARDSNDEHISEAFIEDDFRWHARIGTTEYDSKWMLTLGQFCASFRCLLTGHSQGNYARIFITVFSYVRSLIARLVRMLHVASNETTIAFLESRDCLGRRNHGQSEARGSAPSGTDK